MINPAIKDGPSHQKELDSKSYFRPVKEETFNLDCKTCKRQFNEPVKVAPVEFKQNMELPVPVPRLDDEIDQEFEE